MQARADSEFAAEAGADMADGEEDGLENKPTGPAWEGTDRDYSYEELLGELSMLTPLFVLSRVVPSTNALVPQHYGPYHPALYKTFTATLTPKYATAGLEQLCCEVHPDAFIRQLFALMHSNLTDA